MHVEPREGGSFDQLLRRFKASMDKSGTLREYERKRYVKSNGELQREKAKAAARQSGQQLALGKAAAGVEVLLAAGKGKCLTTLAAAPGRIGRHYGRFLLDNGTVRG
jgi:ribosomal protein S21